MQNETSIIKYCPVCRNDLQAVDVIDIFVSNCMCQKQHRYYIPLKEIYAYETGEEYSKLRYSSVDLVEIISAWLSKKEYRGHLNNQLAEMLRIFIDIQDGIYNREAQKERIYKYCMVCGETLATFESNDLYMKGLRCVNNHAYYVRDCIYSKDNDKKGQLCQYMDYDSFIECINNYLRDDRSKEVMPEQIRELLITFRNRRRA